MDQRRQRSPERGEHTATDRPRGFWSSVLNVTGGIALVAAPVIVGGSVKERLAVVTIGLLLCYLGAYNLYRLSNGRFVHPDGVRIGVLFAITLIAYALYFDTGKLGELTDVALVVGPIAFLANARDFNRQFRNHPDKAAWARNDHSRIVHAAAFITHHVRRPITVTVTRGRDVLERDGFRINLIAILIGVIAGIGAVVFRLTIFGFQEAFFGTNINPGSVSFPAFPFPNLFDLTAPLGAARYLLVPAVGGLLVGGFVKATTTAVRGHGVPEVLESLLTENGRIDPKITVYKTIASSIAIGSGASLGREGPIVQIGSAGGSFFGSYVDSRYTRTLVAAGAGAGIAATFNTPLAGVMFALEILLAEYYLKNVVVVVLSAVTATAVARSILGFTAAPGVHDFIVPIHYRIESPVVEFPLYVLLGFVVAVVGAGVVKLLYATEHVFRDRLDWPDAAKPALGGGLLGLSVLVAALVTGENPLQAGNWLLGVGYHAINESISGQLGLAVLVVLALLKTVGFSLSVGSGSSGGVFSPSLYVGAMVGGAFGVLVNSTLAGTASAGAYALVGTAGVFAATASAPLTATLIIFELTGQYTIILPLLVVTVVGSEIGQLLLHRGTIYTEKLRERGLTVQERRIGSLEDLTAKDVMTRDVDTIRTGSTVGDALDVFRRTSHRGLPIVDDDDHIVGILVRSDLEHGLELPDDDPDVTFLATGGRVDVSATSDGDELTAETPVEEVAVMDVFTVPPHMNLLSLVDRMVRADIGRVPIIDGEGTVAGIVTRSDVLAAYDRIPPEDESRIRERSLAD